MIKWINKARNKYFAKRQKEMERYSGFICKRLKEQYKSIADEDGLAYLKQVVDAEEIEVKRLVDDKCDWCVSSNQTIDC